MTDAPDRLIDMTEASFVWLSQRGFQPRFMVDVGACDGDFTRMFKRVWPECGVLMVEAREVKYKELLDSDLQDTYVSNATLGATDGRMVPFYDMGTGSGIFDEQSPYARTIIPKQMDTLDNVIVGCDGPVDFLKLDVQGYELEVLKGGQHALATAQAVYLEASLVPTNTGCPLIAEVMAFMTAAGFRLLNVCHLTRRRDFVLWQVDLLFLRDDSPYLPDPRLTEGNWWATPSQP